MDGQILDVMGRAFPARPPSAVHPSDMPLVNARQKLALYWSPKSACTATVIWFINTLGRAAEARAYSRWPHDWRLGVFYRSPDWSRDLRAYAADGSWPTLRVIRDPYSRAISIFRQALQFGLESRNLANFLRRDVSEGYSFVEFLNFLAASNLRTIDPHMRVQRRIAEGQMRRPMTIINVSRSDLFAELNRFEAGHGLAITDFSSLPWLHEVEPKRRVNRIALTEDVSTKRFDRLSAKDGSDWPANANFLTFVTRMQIERVYAEDFAAYKDRL